MKRWFLLGLVVVFLFGVSVSGVFAADQTRQQDRDQDQLRLQDMAQDCTCPNCDCPDCTCPGCDCPQDCCEDCAQWEYAFMLQRMFGR